MNDLVAAGGRRSSLLAVLAATLLPFLGIYSVFGQLDSMARTMVVGEILQRGMFTTSMTGLLNPSTTHRMLVLGGVIVGVHIARRGLDLLHDKLGWTVLGLAAAVLEAQCDGTRTGTPVTAVKVYQIPADRWSQVRGVMISAGMSLEQPPLMVPPN